MFFLPCLVFFSMFLFFPSFLPFSFPLILFQLLSFWLCFVFIQQFFFVLFSFSFLSFFSFSCFLFSIDQLCLFLFLLFLYFLSFLSVWLTFSFSISLSLRLPPFLFLTDFMPIMNHYTVWIFYKIFSSIPGRVRVKQKTLTPRAL